MALAAASVGDVFGFALDAVALGFMGFGALVFVLVFLILMANRPADEHAAALRSKFLILGFVAFLFAGVVSVLAPWLQPRDPAPLNPTVSVAFSPSLDAASLPVPEMRLLPANAAIEEETPFALDRDANILIRVDRLIDHSRNLEATARQLNESNAALIDRVETLASAPGAVVTPQTRSELARTRAMQDELTDAINRRDFDAAVRESRDINELVVSGNQ